MSSVEVSVVIPTHARPERLRACLSGLVRQTFDMRSAEVIVVDDGGPSSVVPIADEFRDRLTINALRKRNGGPASARNSGAAVARGRFLAFIDDDCVPDPNWLTALVAALQEDSGALAGGQVLNALPDNPYASATQRIATFVATRYATGRGAERFFTTNNFALSSERFRELGGFDDTIPSWTAEDKEFCDRWRERGLAMVWLPEATVHHAHALNLRRFLRQHYDYGRGILAFRLRRKPRSGNRLVPESPGFYASLVLHPIRHDSLPRALRTIALLALSQVATLAGAIATAVEPSNRTKRRQDAHSRIAESSAEPGT